MANNKVAYGLAKKYGIDTTGMTPKEVWDALKEKGISQADSSEKFKEVEELKTKSIDELKEIATVDIGKKSKDILNLPDEQLPFSLGAKWANKDISMPNGEIAHFVENSKIINKQVFAGKGTKTPIRDIERLVNQYPNTKAENWQKVKSGAIVTCNHFSPDDSFVTQKVLKASGKKKSL